jgi:hypothetical protein
METYRSFLTQFQKFLSPRRRDEKRETFDNPETKNLTSKNTKAAGRSLMTEFYFRDRY